jgi:hypothetical protein
MFKISITENDKKNKNHHEKRRQYVNDKEQEEINTNLKHSKQQHPPYR